MTNANHIHQGQFAELPSGIRLHYASCGERGKPLLLFVHGFPEFWMEWAELMPAFADTHYVVAPDLRGFNLSSKPADVAAYKPRLIVDDLRELIGVLGYDDCTMVAHDWGGAIAWNLAIAHPERLKLLISINSPHPYLFARALASSPAQQAASQYMNWLRQSGSEQALAKDHFALVSRLFCREDTPEGATWFHGRLHDAYIKAWSHRGEDGSHGLTGGVNYYRASPLHPPTAGTRGAAALKLDPADFHVRVPTRIIWGEQDQALLPLLLDDIEAHVDSLEIVRIPEGSHWIVHEQPARIAALIRGWL